MAEEQKKEKAEEKPKEEKPRKRLDDNVILVGDKPFMNYVTGTVMQFSTKDAKEVVVKARGKFISRAVDIAEVVTKRFMKDQIVIKGIKTDSEDFVGRDNKPSRVSAIEIILLKK